MTSISEDLILSCTLQDPAAQRKLYDLLLPYLRAVANRYLRDDSYAMDVLQESFIKIFKNMTQYDAAKSPFKNWAAKIVINSCLNYNKRVIGQPTEEINITTENISNHSLSIESFSDEHLLLILKKVPQRYYDVFNLAIIDGYSHPEIAEILGIKEASSRKQLSRARAYLKNIFTKEFDIQAYLRTT